MSNIPVPQSNTWVGSSGNLATIVTPITAAVTSGATTLTLGAVQMYDSISVTKGSVFRIVGSIHFTATSTTPVFTLTVPYTNVFADANQARGLGSVSKASPAIGDGTVPGLSIVSVANTQTIQISPILQDNSSVYNLTFDISYFLN